MSVLQCHMCNTPLSFRYHYTEVARCSNCTIVLSKNTEKNVAGIVKMPDEPRFDIIGRSFWLNNEVYTLTGVIRQYYTEGYLYKWAAYNHNKYVWLCECLGNWFILKNIPTSESWDFKEIKAGNNIIYEDTYYQVDAVSSFYAFAIEGELPDFRFDLNKGASIECSNDQALIQFDVYENNTFELFQGFTVDINDLKIH